MTPTPVPTLMRAYVGTPDGPELRLVDRPEPAAGQARLPADAFAPDRDGVRTGLAGRVTVAAEDGSGPPAGTRVAALTESDGAEYLAVPTGRLAPLPEPVPAVQAAALALDGLIA